MGKKSLFWILAFILIIVTCQSAMADLNDGLKSYWAVDYNVFTDLATLKWNLTNSGTVNSVGILNDSRKFTGASKMYTSTGISSTFRTQFTACFWINTTTTARQGLFFTTDNSAVGADGGFILETRAAPDAGKIRISVGSGGGSADTYTTTATWNSGAWTYSCWVYDAVALRVYKNGVNIENDTLTVTAFTINEQDYGVSLGCLADPDVANDCEAGFYFVGQLDEIGYWNRSLTSAEISTLYNAGSGYPFPFPTTSVNLAFNESTYDSTVIETESRSFSMTVMFNKSMYGNFTNALYYNGTYYNSTETVITENKSMFDVTIAIPPVNSPQVVNSFHWNLTLYNKSTSTWGTAKSTSFSQEVYEIYIWNCTNNNQNKSTQFFLKDEADGDSLAGSFGATFNVWYQNTSFIRNYSFSLSGLNNYSFCINPGFANYTTNAQIEYSATGYSSRPYYLVNTELDNISDTVYLYLLNDSDDTIVLLYTEDEVGTPLPNIVIKIRRWYPGEGVYKTVEVSKTDINGGTVGHLILYEVPYSFIFESNGVVLSTTPAMFITSTSLRFPIITGDDLMEGYDGTTEVTKSLTFNNATKVFRFEYSDTQNIVRTGCLLVEKNSLTQTSRICYTCVNSTSATILCSLGTSTSGNSYTATAWIKSNTNYSWYNVGVLVQDFTTDLFGTDGLIMAFFIIGIFGMMGAVFKPRYSVGGVMLGVTISKVMGMWKLDLMAYGIIMCLGAFFLFMMRD